VTKKKIAAFVFQLFIWLFVTAPDVLAVTGQLNLDQPEPQVSQPPSMFWLFIKLVISLAVIVGLSYLTVKVLRRKLTYSSAGDSISVLDQHAFAMNKGIYITEVAGRVYVLGVTDHNISVLSEIDDAQVIAGLRSRAQERLNEPVIPPGLLEKFLPRLKDPKQPQTPSFGTHIQEQIRKLHSLVEKSKTQKRDDDTDGR
jgi:flagellar protein FliO/FliZ